MTRPDPVAAALEQGMNATVAWRSVRLAEKDLGRAGDNLAAYIETTLAALLREANPPSNSERSGDAAFDWNKAKPFQSAEEWYSGKPSNEETHARTAATVQWLIEHGGRFPNESQPAAPAVGEDEAIRKWLDARDFIGTEAMMDAGDDLAARVHALLADVARLQKELDGTTFREERYAEDAAGARLALEDARAETLKWVTDHAQLQGKLAAVRKVAENYNNVDFVGDGRIEMTTNPCAAEILNVLEGKP